MGTFIKTISIDNYKCFKNNEEIILSVPDGSMGSGLNILIGENGNGKTTVLEAINLLTMNSFTAESRLSINHFNDFNKEITVVGLTDQHFSCKSSITYFNTYSFTSTGFKFTAKKREIKERGKLLSSPFQITSQFNIVNDQYLKDGNPVIDTKTNIVKTVDGRDKSFDNDRIVDDELNVFYFDKNRTRQLSSGNYKTTFERICDDLNWNFTKNLTAENYEKIKQSIQGDYFKLIEEITNKSFGKKTAKDLKEFFDKDHFEQVGIELIKLLHPFTNSFMALREEGSLTQIEIAQLGSGVEIVLTLLLLKNIANQSKGSIIYLIDEPELHLHPKAQSKLLELLLEESKTKQIILSTHSPYLFKNAIQNNANLLLFRRDATTDEVTIDNARDKNWGLFPWSPSWGEINYFAFHMPTIEFHDELYGSLHEQYISKATDQKDADERAKQSKFETDYLQTKLTPTKNWTREFGGNAGNTDTVTLATFIRNKIHHPENRTMQSTGFTDAELSQSIEELITIVRNP